MQIRAYIVEFCWWAIWPEVEKVVNPVILDDRKYFQNENLAENISKT